MKKTSVVLRILSFVLTVCVAVVSLLYNIKKPSVRWQCNVAPEYDTSGTKSFFTLSREDVVEKFGVRIEGVEPLSYTKRASPYMNGVVYTGGKFYAEIVYGIVPGCTYRHTIYNQDSRLKRWVLIDFENNTLGDELLDESPVPENEKEHSVNCGLEYERYKYYSYSDKDANELRCYEKDFETGKERLVVTFEEPMYYVADLWDGSAFLDNYLLFHNEVDNYVVNKLTGEKYLVPEEYVAFNVFEYNDVLYAWSGKTYNIISGEEGTWGGKPETLYVSEECAIWSEQGDLYYMMLDGKDTVKKIEGLPEFEQPVAKGELPQFFFYTSDGSKFSLKYSNHYTDSETYYIYDESFFMEVDAADGSVKILNRTEYYEYSDTMFAENLRYCMYVVADDLYCGWQGETLYCGKLFS